VKKIKEFKKDELIGLLVTILLPAGSYAAVTEGSLTGFAGILLVVNQVLKTISPVQPIAMPWRVIEIGKDLNTLVNCNLIAKVSLPLDPKLFPKGYQTDWVKPGRSVWLWLKTNRSP
jgi:alpha-glucosidase